MSLSDSMSTHYNAKEIETKWYNFWIENKLFESVADSKKPYTIIMPVINITGIAHLGHTLNNTYQDIMCRFKRLQGYDVQWIPGTDHAGIATQSVVLKELSKKNIRKQDLTTEELISKIWEWKNEKGGKIVEQLKLMGCSCDWSQEQFTLSPKFSMEVNKAFVHLYNKGLIYKDLYIVNHCKKCQTVLSDDEVNNINNKGKLYFIKYYLQNDGEDRYLTVATTRPETIFGDVALVFNPNDARYTEYLGKSVYVPITNKLIPIISDANVDPEFGTGLVKVTPAHDKLDYEIAIRNKLEKIKIIDLHGKICNTNTSYDGMDTRKARIEIVNELNKNNIDKIIDYENTNKVCYRCNTEIEPLLSDQWFMKMRDLAKRAKEVVENEEVKFTPSYHAKVYYNWLDNIRDWTLSRQLVWGHRIPIYTCQACTHVMCEITAPVNCSVCNSNIIEQETDVLDTWFSSALLPFGVFEEKDLANRYPTSLLITGADILFFWVARMIMMGLELQNKVPFYDVYLHGVIRDEKGIKMTKSLGNVIDPIEIIDSYSADILRFTLTMITPQGCDIQLSKNQFKTGRTFCTKLWNSVRYCTLNFDSNNKISINNDDINKILLDIDECDIWILNKLNDLIDVYTEGLDRFDFMVVLQRVYTFLWDDFCNQYLEFVKLNIKNNNTQKVLLYIFDNILRLLHPFIPFITEELWHVIKQFTTTNTDIKSIILCDFPEKINLDQIVLPYNFEQTWKFIENYRSSKTNNFIESDELFNYMQLHLLTIKKLVKNPDIIISK